MTKTGGSSTSSGSPSSPSPGVALPPLAFGYKPRTTCIGRASTPIDCSVEHAFRTDSGSGPPDLFFPSDASNFYLSVKTRLHLVLRHARGVFPEILGPSLFFTLDTGCWDMFILEISLRMLRSGIIAKRENSSCGSSGNQSILGNSMKIRRIYSASTSRRPMSV